MFNTKGATSAPPLPVRTTTSSEAAAIQEKRAAGGRKKAWARELLGWVLSAIGAFLIGPSVLGKPLHDAIYHFLFSYTIFILIWKGNSSLLVPMLAKHYPWLHNPTKRLFISIVATVLLTVVIVVFVTVAFLTYRGFTPQELLARNWSGTLLPPIVATFLISLSFHSWHFLQSWRQTAIDAERLEKENIASQYESLKAQVNPHFLFNSLNVLTSLVETDQKQAVKFIRKLSEVYRYVLDSRQKEVVPLQEELAFLESYIYLQKIRHGEALQIQNNLPPHLNPMVVPLALQLLLENAIKHNMALEEEPLLVHLFVSNDNLVMQNNLQERRVREESTGTGLANIIARYSYLTSKPVQVQKTDQAFIVKLPMLELRK
ncbi:histidine kinase [Pontibacter qinzhouensis]|uniref:Histidine kinase n=1 Tax=Pontibacter qinzhouensis TaxID=2603253 RepID=A0A5C8KBF2_9BACT|nr:sensor histidine kinase [Pontibacter qinzhouensis]TXK52831.1 histidine kinase [Pontibacter qinzhouensis]